jgi:hypothetical protein
LDQRGRELVPQLDSVWRAETPQIGGNGVQ